MRKPCQRCPVKGPAQASRPRCNGEKQFEELVAFKRQHGRPNPPGTGPKSTPVGRWLDGQRDAALNGNLDREKIRRLEALGVDWTPEETAWEERLNQLRDFKKEHGHCHVPEGWARHPELAEWTREQLRVQGAGKLRKDRVQALGRAGLLAGMGGQPFQQAMWDKRFAELLVYKERFGHTRVPAKWSENKPLGHWRHNQRLFRRQGKLSKERIARLDEIGFEWEEPDRFGASREEKWENLWEGMFAQLKEFKERFGHCDVVTGWAENPMLAKWVMRQRGLHNSEELQPERQERLEQLGFRWHSDHTTVKWEVRLAELVAFKERFGHTRVPSRWKENKPLGHWRHVQREWRRKGILKPDRITLLDEIGFEWEEPDRFGATRVEKWANLWEGMFAQLEQFKERFGHCRVVTGWAENPMLAKWLHRQRGHNNKGKLSPDRKQRLESLGVTWQSELPTVKWEERFAELGAFKERFGHTCVPSTWKENRPLGNWVDAQRQFRRKGILRSDRIEKLETIGFDWAPLGAVAQLKGKAYQAIWEKRFEELRAYKERFGHCHVQKRDAEFGSLGVWVQRQRRFGRLGQLDRERKDKLEALKV